MREIELWSINRLSAGFNGEDTASGFGKMRSFPLLQFSVNGKTNRIKTFMEKKAGLILSAFIFTVVFTALVSSSATNIFAQPGFRVEGAGVEASPVIYNGACPGTIKFSAKIQANGAGRVKYTWLRNDGATAPVEYIDFTEAGVRYVSTTWTLGDASVLPAYNGWQQIRILAPNEYFSNKAEFKLTCSQEANRNEQKIENGIGSVINSKIPDLFGGGNTNPKPGPPDCRTLPNGCPPEQTAARFRITVNGFRANRRTNDKFLDEDGAKDEVFLRTDASLYDIWTNRNQPMRQSRVIGDSNTRPERIRAGRATSIGGGNGGFEDGDGFPSSTTPWVRVSAPTDDRPPLLVWEGDLTRDNNALALIPSIWESDENSRLLFNQWTGSVAETFAGIGSDMRQAISRRSGFQPSTELQNALARFFDSVKIPNSGNNDLDRPLGMDFRGGQYGYAPQMLVLTYDAAERIARTDAGFGEGIIALSFKDQGELVGDYTVFLQVERLGGDAGSCAADLPTMFNGTATMRTSHPNALGPFTQSVTLGINLQNCRTNLSISSFPAISSTFPTPVGENTATLTLIGGGTGPFNSSNGRIEIPVRLRLGNTNSFGGVSTIELTLSTENSGAARYRSGQVTLTGSGTFRGGFLDGQTGSFSVTGTFSPAF